MTAKTPGLGLRFLDYSQQARDGAPKEEWSRFVPVQLGDKQLKVCADVDRLHASPSGETAAAL